MVDFTNPFKKKKDEESDANKSIDETLAESEPKEIDPLENSSTIENPQVPTSLPKQPSYTLPKITDDRAFDQLFDESDNEEDELFRAKQEIDFGESYKNEDEDPILNIIKRNIKDLRQKYPTGGIKASRYITTEVLMKASKTYFDKYLTDVAKGVLYVRDELAEKGVSEAVKIAQDNPTDDVLQDKSFYSVHSIASEFMSRLIWRDEHRSIVLALICNEIVGFGRLEPLWRDRSIDEIMCNGPKDVQVEIRGEIIQVPGCYFDSQKQLMDLINRLYGAIGKTVSMTTPLVSGRLHDKSRMFTSHPTVSPDGPNFSIRRHPEAYWTPKDLVQRGSSSEEMMTYIGNLIYKGASAAIVGSTHSGKTSLLNALTGFYKPSVRILTLEDNLEMKPNPTKRLAAAMECRAAAVDRPSDRGVTMRDLVEASLRLRPDVIVVGEVRDGAAFDLCQALNTGHAGASTIHANSASEAIPRIASLITQSGMANLESSLELIASAFDIVVVTKHFPLDGSRRIVSVDEVGQLPIELNGRLTLQTKPLWKFIDQGLDNNGMVTGYWEQVGDISKERRDRKILDIEKDLDWESLKEISHIPGQE